MHGGQGQSMSKIVYVQCPEALEPPQRVWVREPDQPVPRPDEPADYFLDATQPHFPLTDEADLQAWIHYMFPAVEWEVLREIRFV
jgi:hypothetical protein